MKRTIRVFIFSILCVNLLGMAQAQPTQAKKLEQKVRAAFLASQAQVQVRTDWEKKIYLQQVLKRPMRPQAHNQLLSLERQTTLCKGMLLEGNRWVAIPAVCLQKEDFSLANIHLTFANGRQALGTKDSVVIQGDMGYIHLGKQTAQGLSGIAVGKVEEGRTLQESFGTQMTQTLHQFFNSFHIAFKGRKCRIGTHSLKKELTLGEPVLFEGKLVALVKRVPRKYGTVSGKVSEESLALFRS